MIEYAWTTRKRVRHWHTRFVPSLGYHMGTRHRGCGFWLIYKNRREKG